jgi:hypothetical protein
MFAEGTEDKPYFKRTAAERLADRIEKNRDIKKHTASGSHGCSLDGIVARLRKGKQRATYEAVASLVGVLAPGLMNGRQESYACSWVVAAANADDSKRGWPTGYTVNQIDPDCYRQICGGADNIIEDAKDLKQWLGSDSVS